MSEQSSIAHGILTAFLNDDYKTGVAMCHEVDPDDFPTVIASLVGVFSGTFKFLADQAGMDEKILQDLMLTKLGVSIAQHQ